MPLRIGILGLAHGHVGTYCTRWCERDDVQVVAACDRDPKRGEKLRREQGVRWVDDAADLCRRGDVDAVVIGSETAFHAEHVELAAAAGKVIVLQKPMALTMAEADRIVAAVERSGVPFTMAWQMRVDPQNLQMRELVRSGVLGRVFMVRRRHGLATHTWPDFERSWHADARLNRGMWADDAAHAIDFLLWAFGPPESVTAEIATLHNPRVPDDNGVAVFRYADGMIAEVAGSFTCLAGENTTEVIGERGVIIQNFGDGPSANAPRPPGAIGLKWLLAGDQSWRISEHESPANHGDRIAALADPLADFMAGRRPPLATAHEGRIALAMTLACYESAEAGRRVTFPSR